MVARVLAGLLVLGGEPVVYRTLDIEHIGAAPTSPCLPRASSAPVRSTCHLAAYAAAPAPTTPREASPPRSCAPPCSRSWTASGQHPTPAQILDLKLCDPAMGSGAFLLAAARQLGAHLRRAWHDHGLTLTIADDEDPEAHACRLVAQSCLHGVDLDDAAVDLARHSFCGRRRREA